MKTINYTGNSKLISRIVHLLNRKAPMPLDANGDAVWGTNGQVLTTDGNGNTSWTTPQGGGGDVTDVEVNGTSVVDAQGVANVTVPTKTSDLNNDSNFVDDTDLATALADYTPTANLATVATSGDYDDLLNKPSIPDELADLADDSTHRTVTDTQISTWNGKSDFSGSYNDLTDKPTIPTVNDGTLTIQQNGTTLGTFTANQSGNTTVNLTGGGSGGHTIENPAGTDMTQRANLQFADAHLTDDSVNDRTEVEVIEEVTAQGWEDATEDGLYSVDGGSAFVPITGAEIGYDANTSLNDKIDDVEAAIPTDFVPKSTGGFFRGAVGIDQQNGTTSSVGVSTFEVGNRLASGTDKNSKGMIALFSETGKAAQLQASGFTGDQVINFPNKAGTLALTSDTHYSAGDAINYGNLNLTLAGRSTGNSGIVIAFLPLPKKCNATSASVSTNICRLFGSNTYLSPTSCTINSNITESGLILTVTTNATTVANVAYTVEFVGLTVTFA